MINKGGRLISKLYKIDIYKIGLKNYFHDVLLTGGFF